MVPGKSSVMNGHVTLKRNLTGATHLCLPGDIAEMITMFTCKATICINHQPIAVEFIPPPGYFFAAWHIALDPLLLSTALFKVEIHVHFDSLDVRYVFPTILVCTACKRLDHGGLWLKNAQLSSPLSWSRDKYSVTWPQGTVVSTLTQCH